MKTFGLKTSWAFSGVACLRTSEDEEGNLEPMAAAHAVVKRLKDVRTAPRATGAEVRCILIPDPCSNRWLVRIVRKVLANFEAARSWGFQ